MTFLGLEVGNWTSLLSAIGSISSVSYVLFRDRFANKTKLHTQVTVNYYESVNGNNVSVKGTEILFSVKNVGLFDVGVKKLIISNKKLKKIDVFNGLYSIIDNIVADQSFSDDMIVIKNKQSRLITANMKIRKNYNYGLFGDKINKLKKQGSLYIYILDNLNELHEVKSKVIHDISTTSYDIGK